MRRSLFLFVLTILYGASAAFQFGHVRLSLGTIAHRPKRYPLHRAASKAAYTETQALVATENPIGNATISTSSFNLAKSIIGAGVLSLPSGVALFSDEPTALIPATLACAAFAFMGAYSFSLIGRICKQHGATNFKDAWSKSVSPSSSWIITGIVTSLCFLGSLAYSIIIGDSFLALFQAFGLPAWLTQRSNVILLLSSTALLPLCLLQNLSSLAPFSVLGLGGILYAAAFMMLRFFDGSYAPGGQFFSQAPLNPSFYVRGGNFFSKFTIVLLSTLSSSFIAHFNAPKFYAELRNPTTERFNQVVSNGFLAAFALFTVFMVIGFLTFGGNTLGFVLNNYASADGLASIARLAIGLALLTGYPFMFSALREGVLDIQNLEASSRTKAGVPTSVVLLGLITTLALVLKDVGLVVSMTGAIFGNAIMFIIPSIMYLATAKAISNNYAVHNAKAGAGMSVRRAEVLANYGMIGAGVVMTVLGVTVNILRQMNRL